MYKHSFLTQSATWLGEGVVKLNLVQEPMKLYSRWIVDSDEKKLKCVQEIEIAGVSDRMNNFFSFDFTKLDQIYVEMENSMIGKIEARGLCDEEVIAWEYVDPTSEFGGYEFYKKEDESHYRFCCEFITKDQLRSHIQGKMWLSDPS